MKSRNLRILYALLGLAFLVGTLVIANQIARLAETGGIAAADQRLADMAPWFLLLRLGLYVGIVTAWPGIVGVLKGNTPWNDGQRAFVGYLRRRIPLWLFVYEIALPQGGAAWLLRQIFG